MTTQHAAFHQPVAKNAALVWLTVLAILGTVAGVAIIAIAIADIPQYDPQLRAKMGSPDVTVGRFRER